MFVYYSFETDNKCVAMAVEEDLRYCIKDITHQNGHWTVSGYTYLYLIGGHIHNLEELYKHHPEASARLTCSYAGEESTFTNQNGKMEASKMHPLMEIVCKYLTWSE